MNSHHKYKLKFPDFVTGEELSLSLNDTIYQFNDDAWFIGTKEDCDNCFGLRVGVTEKDVLDFAKYHNSIVYIFKAGKLTNTIPP